MPDFPDKKYGIIYADPPWGYRNKGTRAAASKHYEVMTMKDIAALPVAKLAADDCLLFMWATFPMLQEALNTIKAWGFTYKTVAFVWVKQNRSGSGIFWGLGNWTRSNAEVCLLGVKGKPKRQNAGVSSVILSPVERHSKKPDVARTRIKALAGGGGYSLHRAVRPRTRGRLGRLGKRNSTGGMRA